MSKLAGSPQTKPAGSLWESVECLLNNDEARTCERYQFLVATLPKLLQRCLHGSRTKVQAPESAIRSIAVVEALDDR